ncbi:DNA repair protein [Calocera viscosa TUFC12733]|uniref:DNA repair protein REV1 n=1 Tax=Calocera viscosa (strain TUFC12733) TaxID=1330018 RepID=A0A167KXS8_CALVF|nr:DNA repair protein [Calocera viscosa TUFC12733]
MTDEVPSQSSDLFGSDDPTFLEALARAVLPGDAPEVKPEDITQLVSIPADVGPRGVKRSRLPSPTRSPSPLDENQFYGGIGSLKSIIHLNGEEEEADSYIVSDTYGASKFNGWGDYMRRKRAKLQVQNSEIEEQDDETQAASKPKIFRGLAIHINGFTVPSVQVLRAMITQHGGTYHAYLDKKGLVTHVVASNLTPAKVLDFKHMKIVTPDWITKSVEAGRLLSWRDFILHTGEMDRMDEAQGIRTAQKNLLEGFQTQARRAPQHTPASVLPKREEGVKAQKPSSRILGAPISPPVDVSPPVAFDSAAEPENESSLTSLTSAAPAESHDVEAPIHIAPNRLNAHSTDEPTFVKVALVDTLPKPQTPTKLKRPISDLPLVSMTNTSDNLNKRSPSTAAQYSTDLVTCVAAAHIPAYAAHGSNPNAARLMQNPGWAAEHTSAKGADFIEGFYKQSRLHHLSTWKSELKELVAKAQAKVEDDRDGHRPDGPDRGVSMAGHVLPEGKARLDGKGRVRPEDRVIMHCDFDSFFVAASLIDRPHLKGKPVVVCHSQGRAPMQRAGKSVSSTSEVASASYEARKFGIKNGMSLGQARQLCPDVETVPYEFEKYKDFSLQFYTILMAHADDVQAVSVDEALIDVSNAVARAQLAPRADEGGKAPDYVKALAEAIRDDVRKSTGCEISIGASHNILLARLATRKAKPAGSYHLLPEDVAGLLEGLDIDDLHGVGWSIRERMQSNLGIAKVGELAKQPKATLQKLFGPKMGEKLFNAARGIDNAQLESHKQRKSVSAEVNYGIRFETEEQAERFIRDLSREVARRLKNVNMKGRLMTLKVMKRHPDAPIEAPKFMGHGSCDSFSKSNPIGARGGAATDDADIIGEEAWKLMKSFGFDSRELRGLGIQIQKLEGGLGGEAPTGAGQGILAFQKIPSPSKRDREAPEAVIETDSKQEKLSAIEDSDMPKRTESLLDGSPPRETDQKQSVSAPEEVISHPAPAFELPSFTQVDQSVLEALPADIRAELEAEYARARTAPQPQPSRAGPSEVRSPVKTVRSPQDVKHIARQLAPKRNGAPSAAKYSIFKKREPAPVVQIEITNEELQELQIDPGVFHALPGDLQREQLAAQRGVLNLPPRAVVPNAVKPVRESRSPSVGPRRRPVYTANFAPEVSLSKATETPAIRDLIEKWFLAGVDSGPHDRDLKRIGDFLVKCVETDLGMEKAVVVMQWWKHLCQARWDANVGKGAGRAWWEAFRGVKGRLDDVVRKRFGGKLSLD